MKVTHIKAGKIVPSWIIKIQTKGKKHLAHKIKSLGFFIVRHDGALYCYPEIDNQDLVYARDLKNIILQAAPYSPKGMTMFATRASFLNAINKGAINSTGVSTRLA